MAATLSRAAKLVFLLRDPAARFYSAYNMGMNERVRSPQPRARRLFPALSNQSGPPRSRTPLPGAVTYDGFAAALDGYLACAPLCSAEPGVVAMFFDYGMYAKHLQDYVDAFGWERLLVLKSEDMFADPWAVVQQVLEFRGLESPPAYAAQVRGAQKSSRGAKRNDGVKWGGKAYTGQLQCAERLKLARFYRPHNIQLYRMLERDLGWEREVEAAGCQDASAPSLALGEADRTWNTRDRHGTQRG